MMIMNLDYYYTFRFYCNALLQQAALFPRHVDRFFLSGGDSTENAHMHTLARTQHTTHHSSKSISGFFFFLNCLFCLCFGILYYYYYYHHYSTVQVTLFVLFQFRFVMLSIILFFVAFIGYPGVKNSRFTKQRPIITNKAFHCMEYKKKKDKVSHIPTHHTERAYALRIIIINNQTPSQLSPALGPQVGTYGNHLQLT